MSSVRPSWWVTIGMALAFSAGCHGPDYPNCEDDSHCQRDGHHEWCINSHCQQCRTGADCGQGRTCLRNRCFDGPNACEGDPDCPSGQRCQAGHCAPRPECDESHACASGQRCDGGRCVSEMTEPTENRGPVCTMQPPHFSFDDNTLDEAARRALQTDAECLQREPNSRYVLIGRCDPRGTTEYNLALGERRARAVQRYLLSLGVLPDRIAVSSEGSEAASGSDESGWREDRRVDFRLRQ